MNSWGFLTPLIAALSGLAGVGLGGWLTHHWSTARDVENERRKLRIAYLLEAYRRLEASANRRNSTTDQRTAFESAIADIQLLGTKVQIEAMISYVQQHAKHSGATVDSVLEALRADLRTEMGLSNAVPRIMVFRFESSNE
jgi:hypothetical protein